MGNQEQFCLKWNDHQSNLLSVFDQLLQSEALVDVTLACDGNTLKAHRVVLSACSPYFQTLFIDNPCQHPIVILKDVRFIDLKSLVDFMYKGEVNVTNDQLDTLLKTAESLKVRGLANGGTNHTQTSVPAPISTTSAQDSPPSVGPLPTKRKRTRPRHRDERRTSLSDSEICENNEALPKIEINGTKFEAEPEVTQTEAIERFSPSVTLTPPSRVESPASPPAPSSTINGINALTSAPPLATRPLIPRIVDTRAVNSPLGNYDNDSAPSEAVEQQQSIRSSPIDMSTPKHPRISEYAAFGEINKPKRMWTWMEEQNHRSNTSSPSIRSERADSPALQIADNNNRSFPLIGKGHKRYFQQKWTDRYLMVCNADFNSMTCAMCKESLTSFKTDTIKKHIKRKHPHSLSLSEQDRQAVLYSFCRS